MPGGFMNASAAAEIIFREGVQAVRPEKLIRSAVRIWGEQLTLCGNIYSLPSLNNIYVTGAGKATAGMARALEQVLGEHISGGLIAVKYGHDLPLEKIKQIEAAHPVPDENGLKAAAAIRALVDKAGKNDLVICLLSGGASALLADSADGISLDDLQRVSDLLLRSGAAITEINTVRKHLSTLKGGQLARCARPAALVSLIISDVVGNNPAVIASGPTAPDASTFKDALQVIRRFRLEEEIPHAVMDHLEKGSRGAVPETPKPGDALFKDMSNHVIGSNKLAIAAAARQAEGLGYHPRLLGFGAEGRAEELAGFLVKQALDYKGPLPACLLLGGESTVEVRASGKGGRNQHLALAAAIALEGKENITLLSAGTDGTDGPTDVAGAVVSAATLENARRKGLRPADFLRDCDSYHFFEQAGGHIHTGPTQTNVMDLMIALVH
ncbi:glycerate 2-kinase [Anseongella ginsenosidimutans]|uniref:Glycerate 2-kinase n=2 Tax=Anseongella ginsenosidimutans TaxID=496056 RepID=A0A4V2UU56_9SPHI|nr:glycerate 2-kinase [Anseongella ginsenosidimutans]